MHSFLIDGSPGMASKPREKHLYPKENIQHRKTLRFVPFFYFCGFFCLSGSRSTDSILIPNLIWIRIRIMICSAAEL